MDQLAARPGSELRPGQSGRVCEPILGEDSRPQTDCSRIAHMAIDSASLGLRVAQARQRAGLTQEDLARSSELERSAIAKIETGARRITALELARVAEAVGERIEWFVQESPPAIVSHRNMSDPGEPSPRIDTAIDRFVRAVKFTAQHDGNLRSTLRSIPVFDEPTSATQTEALAQQARELIGVGPEVPLHNLSAKMVGVGVLTFVLDLGPEAADAGSVLLEDGAVAVVNGALRTGRRRLALAHEFGHILIADEYTIDWRLDSTQNSRERIIDRFARALLLPRKSLDTQWRRLGGTERSKTREAAVRTASHFRVDMSTLARRLLDLSLIDDETAARVRTFKTERADIVAHDLVVADELPAGELSREYQAAVLRLFTSETINTDRALDLLMDTWEPSDLPELAPRDESEIWQFTS